MTIGGRLGMLLLAAAGIGGAGPAARGDIFHLHSGGTVSGELLAKTEGQYRIRTVVGEVRLAISDVARIEPAPTPFAEYEQRKAATEDTSAGWVGFAKWCEESGLRAEARRHLELAVELDPDYAPAREALGHVRVNGMWVDGRRVIAEHESPVADPQPVSDEEAQRMWRQRIKVIRRSLLDSSLARSVERGRTEILAINDPRAIGPLVEGLVDGDVATRALMLQALKSFPQDEATELLALIALGDPSRELRTVAIDILKTRNDPRVSAHFRAALVHGDDMVVARAAYGLSVLGGLEAVPLLINSLTAQRKKWIELPVGYGTSYPWTDTRCGPGGCCGVSALGASYGYYPAATYWYAIRDAQPGQAPIFVPAGGAALDVKNVWRPRNVTVYRSEVRDALVKITGADFGFEDDRWRAWYEESRR